MKLTKLILSAITILGICFSFQAQSMYVVEAGGETPHLLSGIKTLTFSSGNMNVEKNAGGTDVYAISSVQKVTFQAGGTNPDTDPVCNNTEPLRIWPETTPQTNKTADGVTLTSTAADLFSTQALITYNFKAGIEYTVSFDASSTGGPRDMVIMVRDEYVGVDGIYNTPSIGTTTQKVSYTFTYPSGADATFGELLLAVGGGTDLTLANICISGEPTFDNKDFEKTNNTFLIYPNPADSQFTINSQNAGHLEVISINGKVLMSQNVNAGQTNINISNLSAGMYICRYSNNKEIKTLKLIKQ